MRIPSKSTLFRTTLFTLLTAGAAQSMAAIVANGAVNFYNAESLTSGDSSWADSVPGSGDNVSLGFNDGTAVLAAGDASPSTAIDSAAVFSGGLWANNNTALFSNGDETTSLEIWFKPSDLTGTETLFESGGNSNGTGIGLIEADLSASTAPGGTVSYTLTPGDITEFIQAVIVKDSPNNLFKLYVNGSLRDTSTASGDFAGADQVGMAGRSSGGQGPNGFYEGQIAFVRMYDTALTDSEVSSSYASVIPEPSVLMFIGFALAGLAMCRRR